MYDHAKAIRHALLVAKSAASQVGLPPIYKAIGGYLEPTAQHMPTSGITGRDKGGAVDINPNYEQNLAKHMEGDDYEYRGSHTSPGPHFGTPMHDLTQLLPDDIYGPKAHQYYGTGLPQMDITSFRKVHNVRNKPNQAVQFYRAVPKDSLIKNINSGDWVTINPDYAKLHGDSVLKGKYKILSKIASAKHLWTNGDSIHEWGYHPDEVASKASGGDVEKHVKDFLRNANHQQNHLNSFLDEGEHDLPHLHSVDDVMLADPTVKQLAFGSLEPHLLEKETPTLHSIVKKHGLTASPMDRKGHYWHVEDPQTLTGTTIRWMKDHQQQRGGGFNPHSGERSGDSDIDVHYDPDGILNVHSSEMHPKFSNIANDLHAHYHGKNVMDVLKDPHKSGGGEVDPEENQDLIKFFSDDNPNLSSEQQASGKFLNEMRSNGYKVLKWDHPNIYKRGADKYHTLRKGPVSIGLGWNEGLYRAKYGPDTYSDLHQEVKYPNFHLAGLSVDPDSRQQGYAHQAMQDLTAAADNSGMQMHLQAYPFGENKKKMINNKKLVDFYKQHGFQLIAGETKYDHPIMSREPIKKFAVGGIVHRHFDPATEPDFEHPNGIHRETGGLIGKARELREKPAMGINVKSDTKAGLRYADLIVDGRKTLESRNSDTLRPYVGKRVAIVRTGEGPAKAIGEVTIGEPTVVNKNKFRSMEPHHMVPQGSQFDISASTKHLYPMHDPVRYETERDVGHGIIARKVIHKAGGGGFDPDAGAFGRIGTDPQQQLQSRLAGPQVIKQPGGQWLSGHVENEFKPLRKEVGLVSPEEILSDNPDMLPHDIVQRAHRTKAVNDFVGKQLTRYVKNDMGTEGDPVRALAERGILHYVPNEDQQKDNEDSANVLRGFHGGRRLANHPFAKEWEDSSDSAITVMDKAQVESEDLKENPWLDKLEPYDIVHQPFFSSFKYGLRFDHLIDELHNSVNPESGLPNHLQLRPESLSRMSVPQAVQHVHNINKWREENKKAIAAGKAANMTVHKEYPDGMRWVKLDKPGQFKDESYAMGHSVRGYDTPENGGSETYGQGGWDAIKSGDALIYSLRDQHNQPHVTLEALPHLLRGQPEKYDIYQIKGKGNKKPKAQYIPYVQDFVKSTNIGGIHEIENTDLVDFYPKHQQIAKNHGRFHTKEEANKLLAQHYGKGSFNPYAIGGAIIAKAVGGSIDPQKAIRQALMVSKGMKNAAC